MTETMQGSLSKQLWHDKDPFWDCTCKSSTVYRTNYGIGKTKPLFQRFRVGCKTTEKTNNDGVVTGGW